jgi:DNA-binding SARP family transcriptional activator
MLRLHAFGGLRLDTSDPARSAPVLRRRSLALLAVIAASGSRGVTRERLLGILWPDRPEDQGRHALAQALYALRKELGGFDPFEPAGAALRLSGAALSADVAIFLAAVERGDRKAAIEAYGGPFLDGFYLPQAEEFERWVEEERGRLVRLHRSLLEDEAGALERASNPRGAARLWREVVSLDSIAAGPRIRLMQSLEAAGERHAAIDEARLHREARERELGAGPDPAVAALEASLRAAEPPRQEAPSAADAALPHNGHEPPDGPDPRELRLGPSPARFALAGALVLAVVASVTVLAREDERIPVVAVGAIESHVAADTTAIARPLADLLATRLVQVPGLRVVSRARLLEVLGEDGGRPGPGSLARAARLAGADEIVEGVLYDDPAGYRLDLRRSGLDDGEVHEAVSVTARDPVALVETAVASLAATWRLHAPTEPLRAVTSISLTARRWYDEGLRAYFTGDRRGAARLFRLALHEDTTFAMAAYFLARAADSPSAGERWLSAVRLAERATDRERLLILAMGGLEMNDARGLAFAETLAVRYPDDLDGTSVLGELRFAQGDFAGALAAFDRVMALDSAGRTGRAANCQACDAAGRAIWVALAADSLARAEHIARSIAAWPGGHVSSPANLATVLLRAGRTREAVTAAREAARHEPSVSAEAAELDGLERAGQLPKLDSILSLRLESAQLPESRRPILERLSRIRREGGRPGSALVLATERIGLEAESTLATAAFVHLERALALYELGRQDPGRAREAARLFDSMAAIRAYDEVRMARHRAWMWTHAARARARAGDTSALPALEARIERMAARSSYGRDRRLSYYVRGLLERSRGNWEAARHAFTAASWSPTETIVAPDLAAAALATGRPDDAVRALQSWLRGPLDAANQYVPRWEIHRLLGDAFAAAGRRDSAVAHYDWVRRALANGEPAYRAIVAALPAP